jgi:iron complex transport system substrate-binding protein
MLSLRIIHFTGRIGLRSFLYLSKIVMFTQGDVMRRRLFLLPLFFLAIIEVEAQSITLVERQGSERIIEHPAGRTRVPHRASRVATLGYMVTDAFAAMGLQPVAADEPTPALAGLPELETTLENLRSLGRVTSPSFESLISAEPELILIHEKLVRPRVFRRLSRIAPTVSIDARDPETLLDQIAVITGYGAEARAARQEYRSEVEETRAAVSDLRSRGETVAFVRIRPRVVRLYGQSEGPGRILYEELDLAPGPGVPSGPDDLWVNLSTEEIGRIRADHIFLGVDSGAENRREAVETSPLWDELPAVRAGNVYPVASQLWIAGDDAPIGSAHILEQVERALLP